MSESSARSLRSRRLRGLWLPLALSALTPSAEGGVEETPTRYVRYRTAEAADRYGELEADVIYELEGDIFGTPRRTGRTARLADVRLLPPVRPSKVIGVVANYQRPDREPIRADPRELTRRLFNKLPSTITGPHDSIWLPPGAKNLDWEGELVVVVGKRARDVTERDAMDYVFGLTVGNDVSENTWFREQRLTGKGVDSWGPIGPCVVKGLDWKGLLVETVVNGVVVQSQRTTDMIYPVPVLLSEITRLVTLEPGDIIFTGTVARAPRTPTEMHAGDVVEVRIEGIGTIRNRVVTERPTP